MPLPWFRMYAEFVSDPKVQMLSFDDQRHFVCLLCLKASGTLDTATPSPEFRDRMVSKALGLDLNAALEARRRLSEVGVIADDWQPVKWEARQFKSDHDAADRKRKQRGRDREKQSHNVVTTDGCDSHALEQNRTEQNREDARERAPTPEGLDLTAWNRLLEYRREIRKPIKPASILAAQKKLAGFGSDQLAVVEQSIANGWQGLFPLKDEARPKGRGSSGEADMPAVPANVWGH